MTRRAIATLAALSALSLATTAHAGALTPTYTSYGTLSGATFGGSGIPNDDVAITTIDLGSGNIITLGLTAFGRYSNPELGDNNAGTFWADPGVNDGGVGATVAATWNFGFYVDIGGGNSVDDYSFELYYDFDPGIGTDESNHGVINITGAALAGGAGSLTNIQGAENLYFGYLAGTPSYGFVTPPPGTFNANANGEYTFSLRAYTLSNRSLLGESAIAVNVPDGGATLALLGCALMGLGALRRRFRA